MKAPSRELPSGQVRRGVARSRESPMTVSKVPSTSMLPIPVRYEPSMETIDEHEAKTIQSLIETTERIQAIVAADVGRANRGVHAKAHGLLVGELEILPNLPAVLAQGLFATPQTPENDYAPLVYLNGCLLNHRPGYVSTVIGGEAPTSELERFGYARIRGEDELQQNCRRAAHQHRKFHSCLSAAACSKCSSPPRHCLPHFCCTAPSLTPFPLRRSAPSSAGA